MAVSTIQIELPKEDIKFLSQKAKVVGISIEMIVREMVEREICLSHDLLYTMGDRAVKGGPKDGSAHHDRYLYGKKGIL
ncbi:MAG: hypothetical protein QMD92_08240 [bacterium]|nr:hypothetical protein [bacterium]